MKTDVVVEGSNQQWMSQAELASFGVCAAGRVYQLRTYGGLDFVESLGPDDPFSTRSERYRPLVVAGDALFDDWAGKEVLLPSVYIASAPGSSDVAFHNDAENLGYPDARSLEHFALEIGSAMYRKGMDTVSPEDSQVRVAYFQAAELLYLHAAAYGNPTAFENLGYVYSYDRCQGRYWTGGYASRDASPIDREARACACFGRAAEAGSGEACYKYGDMLKAGRGCEVDLDQAFRWFVKGYEYGRNQAPVVWGSAAWRVGKAYRDGEGCVQSFAQAQKWLSRAVMGLDMAVRSGERWYRNALTYAQEDLEVVRQELDGTY